MEILFRIKLFIKRNENVRNMFAILSSTVVQTPIS